MKELINWHLKRDLINKYRKNNIHVSDKMDTILNDLIDKLLDQKLVEIPPFKKEELEVLRCRYFIQNRTYQAIEAISNNLQRKESSVNYLLSEALEKVYLVMYKKTSSVDNMVNIKLTDPYLKLDSKFIEVLLKTNLQTLKDLLECPRASLYLILKLSKKEITTLVSTIHEKGFNFVGEEDIMEIPPLEETTPLSVFAISSFLYESLYHFGIITVEDLLNVNIEDLKDIANLNSKKMEELKILKKRCQIEIKNTLGSEYFNKTFSNNKSIILSSIATEKSPEIAEGELYEYIKNILFRKYPLLEKYYNAVMAIKLKEFIFYLMNVDTRMIPYLKKGEIVFLKNYSLCCMNDKDIDFNEKDKREFAKIISRVYYNLLSELVMSRKKASDNEVFNNPEEVNLSVKKFGFSERVLRNLSNNGICTLGDALKYSPNYLSLKGQFGEHKRESFIEVVHKLGFRFENEKISKVISLDTNLYTFSLSESAFRIFQYYGIITVKDLLENENLISNANVARAKCFREIYELIMSIKKDLKYDGKVSLIDPRINLSMFYIKTLLFIGITNIDELLNVEENYLYSIPKLGLKKTKELLKFMRDKGYTFARDLNKNNLDIDSDTKIYEIPFTIQAFRYLNMFKICTVKDLIENIELIKKEIPLSYAIEIIDMASYLEELLVIKKEKRIVLLEAKRNLLRNKRSMLYDKERKIESEIASLDKKEGRK